MPNELETAIMVANRLNLVYGHHIRGRTRIKADKSLHPWSRFGVPDMTSHSLRKLAALFAAIASVFLVATVPASAGPLGGPAVANTVGKLNADLRSSNVIQVRRRGRGFRSFRGRRFGRLRHRPRYRSHIRRRYYGHRHYRRYRRYRPRYYYYSAPYVSFSYGSSYYSRCYKPCRWDGHSRRYCRSYCRRHRYY